MKTDNQPSAPRDKTMKIKVCAKMLKQELATLESHRKIIMMVTGGFFTGDEKQGFKNLEDRIRAVRILLGKEKPGIHDYSKERK